MTDASQFDRRYLEAALSWLDARLERLVLLWQLAGQDPQDRFRGLYISGEQAAALSQRTAGNHWGAGLELPTADAGRLDGYAAEALKQIQQIEAEAETAGRPLKLHFLREKFGLSEFELWVLIIVLAPALDLRYEKLFSYLQDDVTQKLAGVDLCLNLLSPGGLERLDDLRFFDPAAPLRRNKLILPADSSVQPGSTLRQAFSGAPALVSWLLGHYRPEEILGSKFEYFPLDGAQQADARHIFNEPEIPSARVLENISPLVCLHGSDPLQHEMTARQMASAQGHALLKVWLPGSADRSDMLEVLACAVRDAMMLDGWLLIQQAEALLDEDGCLLPLYFDILQGKDGLVIFSSKLPFKLNPVYPNSDHPLMNVPFADLTSIERLEIWESLLEGVMEEVPQNELAFLAGQFSLSSGQILAASSTAISEALRLGRPLTSADLFGAAQFHSGHHLNELAQKLPPRYSWEDLVLAETPMAMLKELMQMVQSRPLVLEEWQLGKKLAASNGISALFSGPPGTGKTLSAQIIANELGIDLYRIDLSTVVSKYVGETEKNLEKIFSEASESNAILFFDEADTIFGKRSEVKDAQDRYANLEVGYLLQRMESYNGLAILATNLKANLDEAFTRRLHFIVNFPFPDEEDRRQIWQVLVPPSLPLAEDVDLGLMARRFKLAGGNIRNIILSAAYYAAENGQQVNMAHLMHGARRELQKMGKIIQESDFALK